MSLDTNLRNLATRVSTDTKALRTAINGNLVSGGVVDLSALTTTAKSTLVAAINEAAGRAAALINDAAPTSSTTTTYSASKITAVANAAAAQAKSDILGGVGAAYDTLQEIVAQIQSDEGVVAGLMTALGLRVRVDAAQSFTEPQKAQARSNIDVWSKTEVGPIDTDYVALYTQGQS